MTWLPSPPPDAASLVAAAFAADARLVKVQYRLEVIDAAGNRTGVVKPHEHVARPQGDVRRAELSFPFDLVWLGMGEDGHVASLFPTMYALVRPGPTVIATTPIPLPPEAPFDRLTLNWQALRATREVILVVTGASKKALIVRALAGAQDWPVSKLLTQAGPPVTIYWSE